MGPCDRVEKNFCNNKRSFTTKSKIKKKFAFQITAYWAHTVIFKITY